MIADTIAPTRDSTPRAPVWPSIVGALVCAIAAVLLVEGGPASSLFGIPDGFASAFIFVGAVLSLFLVGSPRAALCVLMAFASVEAISTLLPGEVFAITLTKIVGVVLTVAVAADMWLREVNVRGNAFLTVLAIFLLLVFASYPGVVAVLGQYAAGRFDVEPGGEKALRALLTLVQLGVLVLAVHQTMRTTDDLRLLFRVCAIALTVNAGLALFEYAFADSERIAGWGQNAALLSADLCVGIAFSLVLARSTTTATRRWLWLSCAGLCALAAAATMTRAFYFAALPSLAIGLLYALQRPRFRSVAGIAVLLVAISVPFLLQRLGERESLRSSTDGHRSTFRAGIHMTEDNPALGVGIGNFSENYLRYTHDPRGLPKTGHNSYLTLAAEAGIVTSLVFVLLHLIAFWKLWDWHRLRRRQGEFPVEWAGAIAGALAAFSIIATMHSLHIAKFLWLLLALATCPALTAWTAEEQEPDEARETA